MTRWKPLVLATALTLSTAAPATAAQTGGPGPDASAAPGCAWQPP
ncbi:hypothetical protein [Streptomyces sp. E2N166]|nr:hypothetical protein [Streptomyces sp. E2N166]